MPEAERRVLIVGASAAGLRCACRLKRLQPNWHVTVVEERETFSYAACGLPYLLSGDVEDSAALRSTADGSVRDVSYFATVKGVEVLDRCRVTAVDPISHTVTLAHRDGSETRLAWDDLVLATGARARSLPDQPDHPRVRSVHVLEDVEPLHKQLASGAISHVAVVGAGFLGCELAEAFRALWGADVTLIEAATQVLPGVLDPIPASIVSAALLHHGVRVLLGSPVADITADDHSVRVGTPSEAVKADAVVIAVGAEPVVELARAAGATIGKTGAISVNERLATSVPGVWAAGDCVEVMHAVTGEAAWLPLGSLANRQGRTLANILAGRADRFPAVAGACAVKVFDCNVAAVGCTVVEAESRGIEARAVWITAQDRPHYWPETGELAIQVSYAPGSRWVLGVQVVGTGDAVARVNAAAPLLRAGATLEDLAQLEHAYAPPYSPALEPLAVAAMAAIEQADGLAVLSPFADLSTATVLDVRHAHEQESRPIEGDGTIRVDLNRLRDTTLPVRPDIVVCERGTRSSEAARLLGTAYLGGGLRWRDGLGRGPQR